MALRTFFSAGPVDRNSLLRHDDAALRDLVEHDETRFVAVWQSRCMISNGEPVLLTRAQLGAGWDAELSIYLGLLNGQHLFATALAAELPRHGPLAAAFDNHGMLLSLDSEDHGAVLAYAKGMVEWQQRHLYCSACGSVNVARQGGFVMACSNNACDQRCFPRVDPAIIVLAVQNDHCLLGRQARWPDGRFSTIAGFVEPGEALEDAVRRELHEETNIRVGAVDYLGSQPWPFPGAVMIGFHAAALSTDIRLNDAELAEAGWFSRDRIAAAAVTLPPPHSIAFRLIEAWFDRWEGPCLQSLRVSGSFSRSAGSR